MQSNSFIIGIHDDCYWFLLPVMMRIRILDGSHEKYWSGSDLKSRKYRIYLFQKYNILWIFVDFYASFTWFWLIFCYPHPNHCLFEVELIANQKQDLDGEPYPHSLSTPQYQGGEELNQVLFDNYPTIPPGVYKVPFSFLVCRRGGGGGGFVCLKIMGKKNFFQF